MSVPDQAPATAENVRRRLTHPEGDPSAPPDDQAFFEQSLEAGLRGVRRVLEKRRKTK